MSEPSQILKSNLSPLNAPLTQPFRTALGAHESLENILFTVELRDGTRGYGEAAIATHITGETYKETWSHLKSAGARLSGRDVGDYLRISSELHEKFPKNKSVIAAIEGALLDALTRQLKIPLWKFFGGSCRPFRTDITIVLGELEETAETARRFYRQGFRTFKVKIGKDMDLDFKRVLAVRRHAHHSAIYLDANQGYSAEETLKFLRMLERSRIRPHLIEQPVPKEDWEGLKKVNRQAQIPVCADESIRSLAEATRAIREKAVGVINIKLMKTGIIESREIVSLCKAKGMKLMIGGMLESPLAMLTSAHLAAGLGGFHFIDLDTPFFIKEGFMKNPFLSSKGVYDLRKVAAGIGIVP